MEACRMRPCWSWSLLVIVLMILDFSDGFVSPPRHMAHLSRELPKTKTFLSLDDSWEEVAEAMAAALSSSSSTSITPKEIGAKVALIQWDAVLNEKWVASLLEVFNDCQNLYASLPVVTQIGILLLPFLSLLTFTFYQLSSPPVDYRRGLEPYARGQYDPVQAQTYYTQRKLLVIQRVLQVLRQSNRFLLLLLVDKYLVEPFESLIGGPNKNDSSKNLREQQRAQELLALTTQLGPTAIKIGQALSVRPDLIPPAYAQALASLQDQVPPFGQEEAQAILKNQLGPGRYARIKEGLVENGMKPVASASIGQVYKALLDEDETRPVAIKVQRPNVLAEIALDLYIVREVFCPIYERVNKGRSGTDWQSLANEWGRGFIAELDYQAEARNTLQFTAAMRARGLAAVTAPDVLEELSTPTVLVTEWIEGTRLDQSEAQDVPRLCAVALNAYLVMLLETKKLHCDPHPGNLLRREDGTLCILDFGMTLDIDPALQYSLLEFVAHLTTEDYSELPQDLAALGFLKPSKVESVKQSGVLEPLKYFLRQANKGGGADRVRDRIFDEYRAKYPGQSDDELRISMRAEMKEQVNKAVERESVSAGITLQVEELQRKNKNAFRIPEWFLYTSRAFLTLEGVSLQADPDYSIVQSCFPYVAKRLIGDDDPRARKALRDLLYGAGESVDVNRLTDLAEGFSSYTTTTKRNVSGATKADDTVEIVPDRNGVSRTSPRLSRVDMESTVTLVKDSADILLSSKGNLVQSLLVQESALAASARFKDTVNPRSVRESIPFGVGSLLPPLPYEDTVSAFLAKTPAEESALKLATKIGSLAPSSSDKTSSSPASKSDPTSRVANTESLRDIDAEQAALVAKELRENLPKYGPLIGQLGGKFATALLQLAENNIQSTLAQLEQTGSKPDPLFRTTIQGLSSAAQQGKMVLGSTTNTTRV